MLSRRALVANALAVTAYSGGSSLLSARQLVPPSGLIAANPLYATDGEKITAVVNGERVVIRLIACDAPEAEAGENKSECGFSESRQALNDLITGRTLLLEDDVEDTDKKGRLWRHVWLVNPDGSDGGLLNLHILEQGWATTQEEKKNLKYADEYSEAARDAAKNNLGVTGSCAGFHESINRYGGHDAPANAGETIDVDGVFMTLNSYYYSYADVLGSPAKGGYKYLIANATLTNLKEKDKYGFSDNSFAAKDLDTAADYDNTFAFLNSPLGGGELSPLEYASGDVAIEVQETAVNVRIKFTVSSGKALYWLAPAQ